MHISCKSSFILGCALALVFPLAASAQKGTPSHRPLGDEDQLPTSLEGLDSRLKDLLGSNDVRDSALRLMKDEKLLDYLRKNNIDLNRWKGSIGQPKDLSRQPDIQRAIEWARRQEHLKQDIERLSPVGGTPPTTNPLPPHRPAMPVRPPEPPNTAWERLREDASNWFKDGITKLPDRLADYLDDVGDDTAAGSLRNALRSLGHDGWQGQPLPLGMDEWGPELGRKLAGLIESLPSNQGLTWDDLKAALPDVKFSLHVGDVPTLSDVRGIEGVAPLVLWGAAFAVVGWMLWRSSGWQSGGRKAATWRLGPWPVRPSAVKTRRDLVMAFEYLALLRLGRSALACNHLELGERLGRRAGDVEHHQAATDLARLYERARYAPDNEPLAQADVALARKDLCFLAGVAAA